MSSRLPLVLLAALAIGGAACAQPGPAHGHGGGGGELFISPAGEPFRQGDGFATWFAEADVNHDGAISHDEFRADFARFFKKLDRNGDGQIDRLEVRIYEEIIAPELTMISLNGDKASEPAADDGDVHAPHKEELHAVARFALLDTPEPVSGADENFDDRVSLDEFMHAADRRFDLLDHAHNGKLTVESLRPSRRR